MRVYARVCVRVCWGGGSQTLVALSNLSTAQGCLIHPRLPQRGGLGVTWGGAAASFPLAQCGVQVGGRAALLCKACTAAREPQSEALTAGSCCPQSPVGVPEDKATSSPSDWARWAGLPVLAGSTCMAPAEQPGWGVASLAPSSPQESGRLEGRGLRPNPPHTLMGSCLVLQTVLCPPCLLHVLLP